MRNRRFSNYPDDTDYTTNAPSYYEDLARKEKLIRLLAERIWGYEKILDETLEEIQERFRAWDKNLEDFPDDVKELLQKWLDNGTIDHIINDTIFYTKLDTTIFEQFRDATNSHLSLTDVIKADVAYVDQRISQMTGGAIKGTYTTLVALKTAYPDGAIGPFQVEEDGNRYVWDVNKLDWVSIGPYEPAEIFDGSLTTAKYADDSITHKKISGLETTSNLHNRKTDFIDTSIDASTGLFIPLAGVNTTRLMAVSELTDIASIGYNQIAMYDSNFDYLSNIFHTTEQRKIPMYEKTVVGTAYVRGTYDKNYNGLPQLNVGTELKPYEEFKYRYLFLETDGRYIHDKTVTNEKLLDITNSSNLFNKKTMTTKANLTIPGGEVVPHETYAVTDFIKVKPNEAYIFKNFINVIEYDENGNYIKYAFFQASDRVAGATLTTQPKTFFVRGIFNEDLLPLTEIQINEGSTLLMYDPNEQISKSGLYGVSASPLWKKTLLNFGDSIALGAGVKGYHELLGLKYRMTIHNFSKGGATIRKISSEPANHTVDEQIDDAIASGIKPDYILFNGNTNDWGNITTGEISADYESTLDIETYTGAFENVLRKLKNNFPDAKIVYISAHKMSSRSLEEKTRFTKLAYEICDKYSTPYVDIFNESTLNTFFPNFIGKYTLTPTDATHPNTKGYEKYYLPLIESKLNQI